MNKRCVALSDEQYKRSIELMRNGFVSASGAVVKPNPRVAAIAVLQAALGLRLGDVLKLRMGSFLLYRKFRFFEAQKETYIHRTYVR